MGNKLVMSSTTESHTKTLRHEYTPTNGLVYHNVYITEELVSRILSHVPNTDVIHNCRLVCVNWRDIIDGNQLWIFKCRALNRSVPHTVLRCLQPLPSNFYRDVVFYDPYSTRNLILNPSGEQDMSFWTIRDNGGEGWVVEKPPANMAGVDIAGRVSESCFATSYHMCSKFQIVKFSDHRISQSALNTIRPRIVFSEYYAHRTDCASRYMVKVSLLNQSQGIVDEFEFSHDEIQWSGGVWLRVEHVFADYTEEVHAVRLMHSGHDLQFWAGHYGCKIAGSSIMLDWTEETRVIKTKDRVMDERRSCFKQLMV